jgi:hypothetical protein
MSIFTALLTNNQRLMFWLLFRMILKYPKMGIVPMGVE